VRIGVKQSENPLPSGRKNPRSSPQESAQKADIRPENAPANNSTDAGRAANAKAARETGEPTEGLVARELALGKRQQAA